MKCLSLLMMITMSSPAFANNETIAKVVQACFNAIDRQNYEIKYYSEQTGTLVYEVDHDKTVIIKRDTAYEISAADSASCKKIDLGDIEQLGQTIISALSTRAKSGDDNKRFKSCATALEFLNLPDLANRAERILKPFDLDEVKPETKK